MAKNRVFVFICLTALLCSINAAPKDKLSSSANVESQNNTAHQSVVVKDSASGLTSATGGKANPSIAASDLDVAKYESTTLGPIPITNTTTTTTTTSPITNGTSTTTTTTLPPPPLTSTIVPSTSTSTHAPNTSTPQPSPGPAPKPDRSFDFPSFIGGIILALGLTAIGYVVFKFYKSRTDPNYRSL